METVFEEAVRGRKANSMTFTGQLKKPTCTCTRSKRILIIGTREYDYSMGVSLHVGCSNDAR